MIPQNKEYILIEDLESPNEILSLIGVCEYAVPQLEEDII